MSFFLFSCHKEKSFVYIYRKTMYRQCGGIQEIRKRRNET